MIVDEPSVVLVNSSRWLFARVLRGKLNRTRLVLIIVNDASRTDNKIDPHTSTLQPNHYGFYYCACILISPILVNATLCSAMRVLVLDSCIGMWLRDNSSHPVINSILFMLMSCSNRQAFVPIRISFTLASHNVNRHADVVTPHTRNAMQRLRPEEAGQA
jgi:hypothetical protein